MINMPQENIKIAVSNTKISVEIVVMIRCH